MALRVAIQMDPIAGINPKGDSTLRLGAEAGKRGHELWYYTPDTLTCRDGKIVASAAPVSLTVAPQNYYKLGEFRELDLEEMDVILLRQDPPFDMVYLTTTYLLERLKKPLVINNPASVRNNPEKLFPLDFLQFMPPTLVSSDVRQVEAFYAAHGDIVLKPVYGYGGHGVELLRKGDDDASGKISKLLSGRAEPLMAQKFLPEVKDADRRIILIDGEFCGVFGRIPAEGDIRANMRVGGVPTKAELTPRQREICDALKPALKAKSLMFVGLDCIGDWLTEINVTSPTGLAAITNLYGVKLEETFWDVVEKKLR